MAGQVSIIRGDALNLPLADSSVDLVVTSPPYFGLRSYQDGGEHYDGQIGAEATPAEFVDALIAATREMVRVLKPTGSIFVNLGDKYSSTASSAGGYSEKSGLAGFTNATTKGRQMNDMDTWRIDPGVRTKSLIGIPWRYAIRCIDELGLILRAEVIWSKPNGLPESVTDRVRRSHEQWFHFVKEPRYYSAVDEVREEYSPQTEAWRRLKSRRAGEVPDYTAHTDQVLGGGHTGLNDTTQGNPLGKLPGSVWTVPTEPLRVPDHLGIDHFAAFPTEWPRRIITGWSPREVCAECGEGRRPVAGHTEAWTNFRREHGMGRLANSENDSTQGRRDAYAHGLSAQQIADFGPKHQITGYACDCPDNSAPTTPGVVLDPFGGTGTTALVASVLGRDAISVDMSADYCRLAEWRTSDPKQRAKAARVEFDATTAPMPGQPSLFGLEAS